MSPRPGLLANYAVMHTTDIAHAEERLRAIYGVSRFDAISNGQGFGVRANHLQIGDVGLSYCDYDREVSLRFDEVPFVRQIFNISGSAAYSGGVEGEVATGGHSHVLPAGIAQKLTYSARYRQLVFRVDQAAINQNLSVLLGRQITRQVVFDAPGNNAAMQRMRQLVFAFAHDFDTNAYSSLAAAEVTRGLIMSFLLCHRHEYSGLLFQTPPSAHLPTTKRIEEFIEANWDRPIVMTELSVIAGVSARTLLRQFKKDRGCSPVEFARKLRLDHARSMLKSASKKTSVTQIALRCGFQNAGHFAREFRSIFGEMPSETLRRALRKGMKA